MNYLRILVVALLIGVPVALSRVWYERAHHHTPHTAVLKKAPVKGVVKVVKKLPAAARKRVTHDAPVVSCETVRWWMREHPGEGAEMARILGLTPEQIAAAKKCLDRR